MDSRLIKITNKIKKSWNKRINTKFIPVFDESLIDYKIYGIKIPVTIKKTFDICKTKHYNNLPTKQETNTTKPVKSKKRKIKVKGQ